MLTHCLSDETGRVVAQRMDDRPGVRWLSSGVWSQWDGQQMHDAPVYVPGQDAFRCSAYPVAAGQDLLRVDFYFTAPAESFLQDVVLCEMRLTWPEMQVTESKTAEQPTPSEAEAKQWPEEGKRHDAGVEGGSYGAERDLTFDDVCDIVRRCRAFTDRGGKVTEFYRREALVMAERGFYALETLRGWLKNPRFKG